MTLTDDADSHRGGKLFAIAIVVLAAIIASSGGAWWWTHRLTPYGLESRPVWATSHIVGTPEPPDPFMLQRAYPKLKFDKPLDIAFAPGGRIFVAEHAGKLYSFASANAGSTPDMAFDVNKIPGIDKIPDYQETRLFGMMLDPHYEQNHFVYLLYQVLFPGRQAIDYAAAYPQNNEASRVSRFTAHGEPPVLDGASEKIIITWPGNGHMGGCLKFGPDGMLYISTGDSGDPNPPDPFQIGQRVDDLRSKILRIDPNHPVGNKPYSVPADNPFVKLPGARPEVYAFGLREPWRFSFDRTTGDLWVGDVGWELWESVYRVTSGGNYGWSIMEGPQRVYPNHKVGPTPIIPPMFSLPHTEAASLTGGFVYRGKRIPGLTNQYLFGDWETRRLWGARCDGDTLRKYSTLAQTDQRIVCFGEDLEGEPIIVDYEGGGLWRIVPNPDSGSEAGFPRRLSQAGLFADVAKQAPNVGVIPFSINASQWVDGSISQHYIGIPPSDAAPPEKADDATSRLAPPPAQGNENVYDDADGNRHFPRGTVLARTLSMLMIAGDATSKRNIETQVLHFDGRQWHGYSYQWDDSQTDAELVNADGRDVPLRIIDASAPLGRRQQIWHFNSRAQCMTCHTGWTGYAMAFTEPQLDRVEQYQSDSGTAVSDNQLRTFRHIGLLPEAAVSPPPADGSSPAKPLALVDPYDVDPNISLSDRARTYLHVNCAVCHRFGGGGTALIDLTRDKELKDTRLLSLPMLGSFNIPEPMIVCPGDPSRSVLYYRMSKSGTGRMPHLGSTVTDEKGLNLLARWIVSLRDATHSPLAPASDKQMQAAAEQNAALAVLISNATGDPAVAAIDKLQSTADGALKLMAALEDGRLKPSIRALVAERGTLAARDPAVRDLFERFAPPTEKLGSLPDVEKLLTQGGDVERGRKIFFEAASGLCSRCHTIDGAGVDFGPDLTHIAAKYSRADILDNILHPSKTIAPGYATYIIKTKDGETHVGFIVEETDAELILKDAEHKLTHINIEDIEKRVMQNISAMPEGLLADLQPQQAADLLEYLAGHK